jgi:signal transduction histidine kinase
VEIQISDTATRIPEIAKARVFDPSFDWDDGPGPWLAVAHEVVGQHGGTLTFESLPERGTKFTITLPA